MTSRQQQARVVVVDDHDVARCGLVSIVRGVSDLCVVDEASDAAGAVAAVRQHHPDLVLLDVRMPDTDGLEAARQIRAICPKVRVVMMSSWGAPEYVREAYRVGASGYISKGTSREAIVDEIHRVLRGDPAPMPEPAVTLAEDPAKAVPPDAHVVIEGLTPRQREVLSLLAVGLGSKMIAKRLRIETGTVRKLTEQVYDRLGVSNRTQAALYWIIAAHQPRPFSGRDAS